MFKLGHHAIFGVLPFGAKYFEISNRAKGKRIYRHDNTRVTGMTLIFNYTLCTFFPANNLKAI